MSPPARPSFFFEIEQAERRMTDYARAEVRCVRIHRRKDAVDRTLLLLTPVVAARQVVGEKPTEQRGVVSSRWSERRVGSRSCDRSHSAARVVAQLPATAPVSNQWSNKSRRCV